MGSEDDHDHRRSVNKKIMIILFSCSFAFVLLLVLLHLYSKCLLRGQERSRRRVRYGIRRRQTVSDVEDSIEPQPPNPVGLDPSVMASLPTFTYKEQIDGGHEPVECSVCLAIIVEDVMVKALPNCKHKFHIECIDMWLQSHSTCPICRTAVEPRVQEPEEGRELDSGVQPSAPPLEENMVSRLASFRRMLTMERSSRTRSCGDGVATRDLEER